MEKIQLSNGITLPLVGIGTFPMKGEELSRSILIALNEGYRLLDSAISYKNETDLGCVLSQIDGCGVRREDLIISSKVDCWTLAGSKEFGYTNGKSILQAFTETKDNLGVEYLDIYLLHQPFKFIANQPGIDYLKAYEILIDLYDKGYVKAIGVSNFSVLELEQIKTHCGVYPMINQIELSVFNSEEEVVNYCKENNIHVEAYSPFGRGNLIKEIEQNALLQKIAKRYNKTVFQVALRWIAQRGITVITRSSNEERIKQNIDIFDFKLSDVEIRQINTLNQNKTFGVNKIIKR